MFIKNTAVAGFCFTLVNAASGAPLTGATVTGRVSKDGGAQATLAGAVSELGSGQYAVNLSAAEMNAELVGLLFTAPGAVSIGFTIKTTRELEQALARAEHGASAVRFVRGDGNNANDGLSPATAWATPDHAASSAVAGELIRVGAGEFSLGAATVALNDEVSLDGAGPTQTILIGTGTLAGGAIVKPGVLSRVSNLRIASTGTAPACGAVLAASQSDFSGARLDNVELVAARHCLWIDVHSACTLWASRLRCETEGDAIVLAPALPTAHRVEVSDFQIVSGGANAVSGVFTCGVGVSGGGALRLSKGSIDCQTAVSGASATAAVVEQGGTLEIELVACHSAHTAGGTAIDLRQSGTGSLFVGQSSYDPSKTSGLISVRPVPDHALASAYTAELAARLAVAIPNAAPGALGGLPTTDDDNNLAGGVSGNVLGDINGRVLGNSAGAFVGFGVVAAQSSSGAACASSDALSTIDSKLGGFAGGGSSVLGVLQAFADTTSTAPPELGSFDPALHSLPGIKSGLSSVRLSATGLD